MATRAAGARRVGARVKPTDENAIPQVVKAKASLNQLGAAQRGFGGVKKDEKPTKAGAKRTALGGVLGDENSQLKKAGKATAKPTEARQPLGSRTNANNAQGSSRPIAPVPKRATASSVPLPSDDLSEMDVDTRRPTDALTEPSLADEGGELSSALAHSELGEDLEVDEDDWTQLSEEEHALALQDIERVKQEFYDEVDMFDTTMVAEYADDIFAFMEELEVQTMPSPRYMDHQAEIEWTMRTTLIDWLLQVHLRYHMLPETLWIAVNIVDRFLSARVVSLIKLQLVGVTAMFIAAKYEEILAPSVEEFVFMTENGYSKEEILKGERIILQTLNFEISSYCSPYSWVRRISKADDYDIQTRTLSKFLMEVTLLDHRFLRCKPSMVAAIGMYLARKMLGGDWNDSFIYYSKLTESQLTAGAQLLCERLVEADFESVYVYKKYANKKFLRASTFAREWAQSKQATGW